jgi:hypothetical protein
VGKRDPREFGEMPSMRRRKAHPFDEAEDAAVGADVSGKPDVSDAPGKPNAVRVTRGSGETVRRATFWITDDDMRLVEELRGRLRLPGVPGVPDKSAIVREAIRRLARSSD